MSHDDDDRDDITEQFIDIAQQVSLEFPELDLRFSLQSDSNILRYSAADVSQEVFELELGLEETTNLVYEAIFKVKQVAQLFDA